MSTITLKRLSTRELFEALDRIDDTNSDNYRFIEAINMELKSRQY